MGLRGAGYRWLQKKRDESKKRRAEQAERKKEFEEIKHEEMKKAYKVEVRNEAVRQARSEARSNVQRSFKSGGSGITGALRSEMKNLGKTVANSPVGTGSFMTMDSFGTAPRPKATAIHHHSEGSNGYKIAYDHRGKPYIIKQKKKKQHRAAPQQQRPQPMEFWKM